MTDSFAPVDIDLTSAVPARELPLDISGTADLAHTIGSGQLAPAEPGTVTATSGTAWLTGDGDTVSAGELSKLGTGSPGDADPEPADFGSSEPSGDTGPGPVLSFTADEQAALAALPRGDWTADPNRKRGSLTGGQHKALSRIVLGLVAAMLFAPLIWILLTMLTAVSHAAH